MAVAKKDAREYLKYVFSDGKRIMASDGHRVHYGFSELEKGYYCPKTKLKIEDDAFLGKFPDIDKVLATKSSSHLTFDKDFLSIIKRTEKINVYKISDSVGVNCSYLQDALQEGNIFTIDKSEKEHINGYIRVYGVNSLEGHYTIMGIRLKNGCNM